MINRKDELLNLIPEDSKSLVVDIVDQIVFIESQLESLKKLPFIEVNKNDPTKQRNTPASKMYKEFLQQYINAIKVLESIIYRDKRLEGEEIEESPLRKWFKTYDDGK